MYDEGRLSPKYQIRDQDLDQVGFLDKHIIMGRIPVVLPDSPVLYSCLMYVHMKTSVYASLDPEPGKCSALIIKPEPDGEKPDDDVANLFLVLVFCVRRGVAGELLVDPVLKSLGQRAPGLMRSPGLRSIALMRSIVLRSPVLRSPILRSPILRSPILRSPALRSPGLRRSPVLYLNLEKFPYLSGIKELVSGPIIDVKFSRLRRFPGLKKSLGFVFLPGEN